MHANLPTFVSTREIGSHRRASRLAVRRPANTVSPDGATMQKHFAVFGIDLAFRQAQPQSAQAHWRLHEC